MDQLISRTDGSLQTNNSRAIAVVSWISLPVLGDFAKLRKMTVGFVVSVCLPIWIKSVPTGGIFVKFVI